MSYYRLMAAGRGASKMSAKPNRVARTLLLALIALAAICFLVAMLTSCQSDELTGTGNGQPVPLTLSALLQAEGDVQTRTAVSDAQTRTLAADAQTRATTSYVPFTLSGSAPFSITLEKSLPHGGSGSSIVQTGEYNVDAALALTYAGGTRLCATATGQEFQASVASVSQNAVLTGIAGLDAENQPMQDGSTLFPLPFALTLGMDETPLTVSTGYTLSLPLSLQSAGVRLRMVCDKGVRVFSVECPAAGTNGETAPHAGMRSAATPSRIVTTDPGRDMPGLLAHDPDLGDRSLQQVIFGNLTPGQALGGSTPLVILSAKVTTNFTAEGDPDFSDGTTNPAGPANPVVQKTYTLTLPTALTPRAGQLLTLTVHVGHAVASIAGEPQISDFTPGNDDPDSAPGSGQGITSTPGIAQGDGMKPLDPTLFCKDNPVWVISGGGQQLVDDPDAADPANAPQITRDELVLRNVRRALNGIFEPDYSEWNDDNDLYDGANGYIDLVLTGVTKLPMSDPNDNTGAFYRYRQLRSISMPEVTETGENAFAYCSALTSVSLPKATDIVNQTFSDCSALTYVSLPEATGIGISAFSNCIALTAVSLPKATGIGDTAFESCIALKSISLPEAMNIGRFAFMNCRALKSVSLPEATDIGISAFEYCSALTYISLPEATDIGKNAFSTCSALKSISLPEATDIGDYAFRECRALTRLDISGVTDSGNLGSNIFVNAVTTNCDLILSKTMYDDWNVNGGTYALYRYWKTITYK